MSGDTFETFERQLAKLQGRHWQVVNRDDNLMTASLYKIIAADRSKELGRGGQVRPPHFVHMCRRAWMNDEGQFQHEDVPCNGPTRF